MEGLNFWSWIFIIMDSIFFGTVVWIVSGNNYDPLHDKLWARILLTALASLAILILMLIL